MTLYQTIKKAIAPVLLSGALLITSNIYQSVYAETISAPPTEVIFAADEEVPLQEVPAAEKIRVMTGNARLNIRSGPGIDFAIVGKYPNETIVLATEKQGDWIRTDRGWIHTQFTQKIAEAPASYTETQTTAVIPQVPLNLTITQPSGMTLEQINALIADSGFAANGKDILDCEREYSINAFFTIAIARLESANGHYPSAKAKNNMFGMMGKSGLRVYGSVTENIHAFSRNMRNNYFNQGRQTILSVGTKYCPPTSQSWASKVTAIMNRDLNKVTR